MTDNTQETTNTKPNAIKQSDEDLSNELLNIQLHSLTSLFPQNSYTKNNTLSSLPSVVNSLLYNDNNCNNITENFQSSNNFNSLNNLNNTEENNFLDGDDFSSVPMLEYNNQIKSNVLNSEKNINNTSGQNILNYKKMNDIEKFDNFDQNYQSQQQPQQNSNLSITTANLNNFDKIFYNERQHNTFVNNSKFLFKRANQQQQQQHQSQNIGSPITLNFNNYFDLKLYDFEQQNPSLSSNFNPNSNLNSNSVQNQNMQSFSRTSSNLSNVLSQKKRTRNIDLASASKRSRTSSDYIIENNNNSNNNNNNNNNNISRETSRSYSNVNSSSNNTSNQSSSDNLTSINPSEKLLMNPLSHILSTSFSNISSTTDSSQNKYRKAKSTRNKSSTNNKNDKNNNSDETKRLRWSENDIKNLWISISKYGNEWIDVFHYLQRISAKCSNDNNNNNNKFEIIDIERTYHQVKDKGRRLLKQKLWKTGRFKQDYDGACQEAKAIAKNILKLEYCTTD